MKVETNVKNSKIIARAELSFWEIIRAMVKIPRKEKENERTARIGK